MYIREADNPSVYGGAVGLFAFSGDCMQQSHELGAIYYRQYGRGLLGDVTDGETQVERVFPERRPRRVVRAERKKKKARRK